MACKLKNRLFVTYFSTTGFLWKNQKFIAYFQDFHDLVFCSKFQFLLRQQQSLTFDTFVLTCMQYFVFFAASTQPCFSLFVLLLLSLQLSTSSVCRLSDGLRKEQRLETIACCSNVARISGDFIICSCLKAIIITLQACNLLPA